MIAAAVFGIALAVSDDLRLLYATGALLFAAAAFFLSTKAGEDLIAAALLLFPSTFLFAFFVLPQTPVLWPTLLLWVAIVVWLLFWKRFNRIITIVGAIILIAVSSWYCAFHIPTQMQRALTHVGNGAAPQFTLQPISQTPVPVRFTPGRILVLDFFATWCSPCIAELPELERVRTDLQDNRNVEIVLVGTNKGGDTPERVRAFAQHRHISLPVAFDPEQTTMSAFWFERVSKSGGDRSHRSFAIDAHWL